MFGKLDDMAVIGRRHLAEPFERNAPVLQRVNAEGEIVGFQAVGKLVNKVGVSFEGGGLKLAPDDAKKVASGATQLNIN